MLSQEVQEFIRTHENDDVNKLVLQHKEIHGVAAPVIAAQIIGRRKTKEKLSNYYACANIIYPPAINLEQSSSSQTALFKAHIAEEEVGVFKTCVDLTGGFGIDSYFLSKVFDQVQYVETNASLLETAHHNHIQLQRHNISYYGMSAEEYLKQPLVPADLFYIDPSRRNKTNQKIFKLSDCEPDITLLQDAIFERSNFLLLKTSPLLDIQHTVNELKHVKKVFIISVGNECKELLFLSIKGYTHEPERIAINILKDQIEKFSFTLDEEKNAAVLFDSPKTYLYEPNASLMKAGAFKTVAVRYALLKIHPSTHLYTSDHLVNDFPGRIFLIEAFVKSDKKSVHLFFPEGKANVTTRNYPLSVDELKKKTNLKDGGEKFLIGFSGLQEKFLTVAQRIR